MSFDPFSLDYFYYPVSAIMWLWYKAFSAVPGLGPASFFTWTLSVMFLVFTLRAILYNPFVRQIRTTRQMQELQPQIKALQKKYGKDRQRMALEMQKLQREHGFNPILGCLPMLVQVPVFLGPLSRAAVLQPDLDRHRTAGSVARAQPLVGQLRLQRDGRRPLPGRESVRCTARRQHDAARRQPRGVPGLEFSRPAVAAVGVPVMILAGIATYFNSRASVARQSVEAAANPQTAMMNKLALYVFPLGVVVGGPFLPLAIIFYWFANNIWTFGQQHYVFRMIEREDEEKKREAIERRSANAPAPGAKPKRSTRNASAGGNGSSASDSAEGNGAAADSSEVGDPVSRAPRPGAKPKKRRR